MNVLGMIITNWIEFRMAVKSKFNRLTNGFDSYRRNTATDSDDTSTWLTHNASLAIIHIHIYENMPFKNKYWR